MNDSREGKGRFARIILAAGQSRRMGQPKALLPFGQQNVMERVIEAGRSAVELTVIVVNPGLANALGGAGLRGGGLVARAERLLAALVDGVARGAGTGSATVRRSSGTGQLHHYYLQVTGALLLVVCVPLLVLLLTNPR